MLEFPVTTSKSLLERTENFLERLTGVEHKVDDAHFNFYIQIFLIA